MIRLNVYLVHILYIVNVFAIEQEIVELPVADREKGHAISKKCAADNGIDDPNILMTFQNYKTDLKDPKMRKYAYCFLYNIGYIDANGLLDRESMIYVSQGHKTDEFLAVVDKCNSLVTETDPEEAAVQVSYCYGANSPLHFYTDLP